MEKPQPIPTSDSRPFWEACARGELLFQRCLVCNAAQFYPRTVCIACGSDSLAWRVSGRFGVIFTFTIVRRAPSASFKGDVPYVIALVDVDEGFRMMLNVRTPEPEQMQIGQRVRIVFEVQPGGCVLPQAVVLA